LQNKGILMRLPCILTMNMPPNIETGKTAGPGQPFERLVPNPKARVP
jgi:hypothetical protein